MRVILILCAALLLQSCGKKKLEVLTSTELETLLTNITMIGQSPNSKAVYEINFMPNQSIVVRKNMQGQQVSRGTWRVQDNAIQIDWQGQPISDTKRMQYVHVKDNIYDVYDADTNKLLKAVMVVPGLVHLEMGPVRS